MLRIALCVTHAAHKPRARISHNWCAQKQVRGRICRDWRLPRCTQGSDGITVIHTYIYTEHLHVNDIICDSNAIAKQKLADSSVSPVARRLSLEGRRSRGSPLAARSPNVASRNIAKPGPPLLLGCVPGKSPKQGDVVSSFEDVGQYEYVDDEVAIRKSSSITPSKKAMERISVLPGHKVCSPSPLNTAMATMAASPAMATFVHDVVTDVESEAEAGKQSIVQEAERLREHVRATREQACSFQCLLIELVSMV